MEMISNVPIAQYRHQHRSLEGKCIAIDVRKLGFQQLLGKLYMLICETLSLLKVFLHLSGEWWKFLQLSM